MVEGSHAEMVEIVATLPPSHICAKMADPGSNASFTECTISLTSALSLTGSDLTCLQDNTQIPQVVIGLPGCSNDTLVCGVTVTMDNWFTVFQLSVKAKIDGFVDGDQTRELTLYSSGIVEDMEVVHSQLSVIQVCSS